MSLRALLTLLVAACVAVAVVAVSAVAYFATENRLVDELDATLEGRAQNIVGGPPELTGGRLPRRAIRPGVPSVDVFQVIRNGQVVYVPPDQDVELPIDERAAAVAAGTSSAFFRNTTIDGREYRVYTSPGASFAVQVARPLDEVNGTLRELRNILVVVSIAGVAVAAVAGAAVANRALRPVGRLTAAAEAVAATQDLSQSIEVERRDEVGRLAASFNTMLDALDASKRQQRQLVIDANHELRTPLTSLRTNIEMLARADGVLPEEERRAILEDAKFEIDELTKIAGELVDLATDPRLAEREREDVRIDEVTRTVTRRAERRSGLRFDVAAEPMLVSGSADLLERAITNVVDNACKFSTSGSAIEVSAGNGRVVVRDHGPGIPPDDLPHVFERFYRSAAARSQPGSGLGLAIVKQIIEAHGGTVAIESGDGGTTVTMTIPQAPIGS